jgi:hypothetical protein
MVRDSRGESEEVGTDTGWKHDIPRMLYQHICVRLLFKMSGRPDYVPGDGIHEAFSINEWNDAIGKVYVPFFTDGDLSESAIVYHTTRLRRNRNIGLYQIYEYHPNQLPSIPLPLADVATVSTEVDRRSCPDVFWSALCQVQCVSPSFKINLRTVLLGSLLLKLEPQLLGRGNATLSQPLKKKLHRMQITVDRTVSDFVPDFKILNDCVKNSKKIWLFERNPFANFEANLKEKHLKIVKLCQNFKIEGEEEGVGDPLDGMITQVISQRKLLPILEMGLQGMNGEYVEFMLKLQGHYERAVHERCHAHEAQGANYSPRKVAQTLANEWRNYDFDLPFL